MKGYKAISVSWIVSLLSLLALGAISYLDPSLFAGRLRNLALILFFLVLIVYWAGKIFTKD